MILDDVIEELRQNKNLFRLFVMITLMLFALGFILSIAGMHAAPKAADQCNAYWEGYIRDHYLREPVYSAPPIEWSGL